MSQKTLPWLLLLIISATINSVYNVPTRKSFDLHVPGKAPIRIIDSESSWDRPPGGSDEFEHRTTKGNTRFRATTPHTFNEREDSTETNVAHETPQRFTEFPSSKLQNFLKNFANNIHKKNEQPSYDMDKMKLMNRPDDEDETNFSETLHDDSSDQRQDVKQDKANKWDLIHVQKYQQPVLETAETNRYHGGGSNENIKPTGSQLFTLNNYHGNSNSHKDKDSNKQGWVTLEAVPWSVSKISKWESNNQQKKRPWHSDSYGSSSINSDKYNTNKYTTKPWLSSVGYYGNNDNPNPWEHYTATVPYRPEKPSYTSKPTAGYRPHSSYYSNRPGYDKDDLDVYHLSSNPGSTRPVVDYDQNLYNRPILSASLIQELSTNPFTDRPWNNRPSNRPSVIGNDYGRPYWNKLSQLHHNQQYHSDNSDCEHSKYKMQGDIITDGLPGNFPKELSTRRRGVEPEEQPETDLDKVSDHPETHPVNGNGEWVLLSTTKGYQYQRPAERQRSLKIVPAQRQVRLTVLPPDKDSKINMTTSHGGMLEVESTFQTVEQSQKQYAKQMRFNGTRIGIPQVPTQVQKLRNSNGYDSTAVVAAVGAGMIPAAAIGAMLVPMAMGRKKRSLFATTHHPLEHQLTLPRNL